MATQVIKTTFQFKRGYADSWKKNNPILAPGEPGWTLDTHVLKIGDGITPWNELEILSNNAITEEQVQILLQEIEQRFIAQKYEISSTPQGTLINHFDGEIRVMCPKNTLWQAQNVGANGNPNMYYMSFKAYAPAGAVGFKEGDRGVIIDKYYDFNDDFAGTDAYGRNYSICWLALAMYNESSNSWTYFGANSNSSKYIGWDYVVEWYDANGDVMAYDNIRINLSNEDCHYISKPYYMNNIDVNALTQKDAQFLVLYGGSASDNI